MPAAGEPMMLSRLLIVPGVEHTAQIIGVDLCVLMLKPRGSTVLQGKNIINAPRILWSTPSVDIWGGTHLKARSQVWSRLFLLSGDQEVVWWWLLLRNHHSWALSLTVIIVVSSSSHLCLVFLSLGAILWPSGLLSFCVCFLIWTLMVVLILCWSTIFKYVCGYYYFKIKYHFSYANPSGIVSGVLAIG